MWTDTRCCKDVEKNRKGENALENADLKFIDSVLEKYDSDKSKIIAIMQDVQEKYRAGGAGIHCR